MELRFIVFAKGLNFATFFRDLIYTVDSRLSARGLTALRLNRGNVFLKKKIYFP
jgi:hypothetical protein